MSLLIFYKEKTMAYQGYLIKVGNYTIPLSMIAADTYQTLRSGQDLDSTRNENGILDRNALAHFINKVEFEIPSMKTNVEISNFLTRIRENFIDDVEQNMNVTFYVPMLDDYITKEMYLPDVTFKIDIATKDYIKYNKIRFAFIEY